MKNVDSPRPRLDPKYRFLERRKTLAARPDVEQLAKDIRQHLATAKIDQLRTLLHAEYPADLADALFFLADAEDKAIFDLLDTVEAAAVLDEVDALAVTRLIAGSSPERLGAILCELLPDEATDIVGTLDAETREHVLALMPVAQADAIRTLLAYPK